MTDKFKAKNIVEAHLQSLLGETTTIIKEAQNILTNYLVPDSHITAEAAISDLLQLFDNDEIIDLLNEANK